jgi:F-type H+-transporting ATPase subunit b
VSPRLATFLYEAVNFLALALLLGWLFFKPVRQALADYRRRQEEAIQSAEKIRADAERMRAEIVSERDSLNDELSRLRAQEFDAARRQAQQLLADADALAARKQKDAVRRVHHLEETEASELGRAAAVAAARTVTLLLERIKSSDLESALVRSACEELTGIPKESLAPVKIETARPLSSENRARVEALLQGAAQGAVYHVNDELCGGIRIWTAQGLIDASVVGLSRYAEQVLRQEMNNHPAQGPSESQDDPGAADLTG